MAMLVLGIIEFLARPPGPEPGRALSAARSTGAAVGAEPPPSTADEPELVRTDARG